MMEVYEKLVKGWNNNHFQTDKYGVLEMDDYNILIHLPVDCSLKNVSCQKQMNDTKNEIVFEVVKLNDNLKYDICRVPYLYDNQNNVDKKTKRNKHKVNKTRLHYSVDNEDLFLSIVNAGYASELRGNNDINGKKIYFFNKLDEIKKIIDEFYNDIGEAIKDKIELLDNL